MLERWDNLQNVQENDLYILANIYNQPFLIEPAGIPATEIFL
jgi:hypothetical protein